MFDLDDLKARAAQDASVTLTPGLTPDVEGRGVALVFDSQGARLVECASVGDGYPLYTTAAMNEIRLTWGELAELSSNGTERLRWGAVTLTPDELARLLEVVTL